MADIIEKTKTTKLIAGVVLILSLIGTGIYFIAPEDIDNLYYCNESGEL